MKVAFEVLPMKMTVKGLIPLGLRRSALLALLVFMVAVSIGVLVADWFYGNENPGHVSSGDIPAVDNLERERGPEYIARDDSEMETKDNPAQEKSVRADVRPKSVPKRAEPDPYQLPDSQESLEQDRRAKMWSIVDSFGSPSVRDKVWLESDGRNKDVSEMLAEAETKLGRLISEEVKALLLESARRMWYRMDRLVDMYNNGEIGYLEYSEGIARISMLNRQEEGDLLSDEEFAAYNGETKPESAFLIDPSAYDPSILMDVPVSAQEAPVLSERDAEFFALYSGIRKNYPEIRTLSDAGSYISEVSVDVAVSVAREFMRTENELAKLLREGRINKEAYKIALGEARQKAKQEVMNSLSDTERDFLFKN